MKDEYNSEREDAAYKLAEARKERMNSFEPRRV